MAVSYRFEDPATEGVTLVVASDDLASLADWLTDSMRLAGSGGEWSAGDPWGGDERGEVSRVWLHPARSGDPPMRGFAVRDTEGEVVGLALSAARAWRNDVREGTERAIAEGVVAEGYIVEGGSRSDP